MFTADWLYTPHTKQTGSTRIALIDRAYRGEKTRRILFAIRCNIYALFDYARNLRESSPR